jgi:hypothetical protein
LEAGKTYHYDFEARVERDGKVMKANKRVDVHAGDQLEVNFTPSDLKQAERRESGTSPDK